MNGITELIPVEKLSDSPDNPRREVGDVSDLALSFKSVGIIEPLIVTQQNGGYMVVAGARRLAAAKEAGLPEVPCIVRELDAAARAEIMLVENIQRADLAPLEEASAYERLIDLTGYSQHQLADRIGRSQAHVSKRLALLTLPAKAKKALDNGGITVADAIELTKLADMPKRLERAMRGHDVAWSVKNELREHQDLEKAGKAIQQLKAEGVKILDEREHGGHFQHYKAGRNALGSGYEEVRVSPKAHASEPCHAVVVTGDGTIQPVCTKPARHAKGGASKAATGLSDSEKAKRRAKIDHNRARRTAAEGRGEFVSAAVASRVSAHTALMFIVDTWLVRRFDSGAEEACALLGLPDRKGRDDAEDVIRRFASKNVQNAAKAAVALVGAYQEHALANDFPRFDEAAGYFKLLRSLGYRPSDAEKLELAGKAPR